jgi:hypothetical protein
VLSVKPSVRAIIHPLSATHNVLCPALRGFGIRRRDRHQSLGHCRRLTAISDAGNQRDKRLILVIGALPHADHDVTGHEEMLGRLDRYFHPLPSNESPSMTIHRARRITSLALIVALWGSLGALLSG